MTPDEVEALIIETKRRTNRPFAVNIPLQVTPHAAEIAELVIRHQVPVVSLSAGNPAPWIPRFAEHGIKVIVVVASVSQAKKRKRLERISSSLRGMRRRESTRRSS